MFCEEWVTRNISWAYLERVEFLWVHFGTCPSWGFNCPILSDGIDSRRCQEKNDLVKHRDMLQGQAAAAVDSCHLFDRISSSVLQTCWLLQLVVPLSHDIPTIFTHRFHYLLEKRSIFLHIFDGPSSSATHRVIQTMNVSGAADAATKHRPQLQSRQVRTGGKGKNQGKKPWTSSYNWDQLGYPLVNVYITMENHHF